MIQHLWLVNQKKGGGSGSKKSKEDVKCFNCHKKGYYKRDCWAPSGSAEEKVQKIGRESRRKWQQRPK